MPRRLAPALLLAILGGCAAQERHYPSLAPRAVEKQGFGEPVVATAVTTPDPALDDDIVRQRSELERIAAGFAAAATRADKAAAAAAHRPVGSDAWLDAQGALAALDGWRNQASALTAAIEAAGSARAAKLQPPYPTLEALSAQAAAEDDREAATVARLQAAIPAA